MKDDLFRGDATMKDGDSQREKAIREYNEALTFPEGELSEDDIFKRLLVLANLFNDERFKNTDSMKDLERRLKNAATRYALQWLITFRNTIIEFDTRESKQHSLPDLTRTCLKVDASELLKTIAMKDGEQNPYADSILKDENRVQLFNSARQIASWDTHIDSDQTGYALIWTYTKEGNKGTEVFNTRHENLLNKKDLRSSDLIKLPEEHFCFLPGNRYAHHSDPNEGHDRIVFSIDSVENVTNDLQFYIDDLSNDELQYFKTNMDAKEESLALSRPRRSITGIMNVSM